MRPGCAVVVPWVSSEQLARFLTNWNVKDPNAKWLVAEHDSERTGSGATKNRGIARALSMGFELVVVIDDDCYPQNLGVSDLMTLSDCHAAALRPQNVQLFTQVTEPPSRGTPYSTRTAKLPVAASMGFWTEVGDYCAVRQLAFESEPMEHFTDPIHGSYFPLCGMNLAFYPEEWEPWCRFIEVPRYDDIWMGWLWQREAYRRGYCFNLGGPTVRHARQSNVWNNLRDEAKHLERNETLWRDIALMQHDDYDSLRSLLPV